MKLQFLNSFPKRLAFSMILSVVGITGAWSLGYTYFVSVYYFLLIATALFLPISIFYAVVSTFFPDDTSEKNDDILDDINSRRNS